MFARTALRALHGIVPLLLIAGCSAGDAPAALEPPPNIVWIYTDDQRFDCFSAAGNPYIETPNLDRLAREGALFERAYATTSRCCPARVSMLTGKYAHITGVQDNHPDTDFQERHQTVADHLRRQGYKTAFIGKWHLPNPGGAPRPGFDHWVSYEGSGHYFDQSLNVDGTTVESEGFQTDVLTDYAVRFIEKPRGDAPFLLLLALKNSHVPLTPPPRHAGRLASTEITLPASIDDPEEGLPRFYRGLRTGKGEREWIADRDAFRDELRAYWELALSVDESVGRLLSALEEEGELDRTVIVFTTDNGQLLGEHGLQQKGVAYEPSIRLPLLMRYPARVPAGTRVSELVLNVDLAPTTLELAGLRPPDDMQGRSVLDLWRDNVPAWRQRFLYLGPAFGESENALQERALCEERWKYVLIDGRRRSELLFDLANDPDERTSVADDPEQAERLARMRQGMDEEMTALGVPRR